MKCVNAVLWVKAKSGKLQGEVHNINWETCILCKLQIMCSFQLQRHFSSYITNKS